MKTMNPQTVAAPLGAYSHVVEVGPESRWLVVSGQVGNHPDGTVAEGIEGQSEQTWRNLVACLEAAGMAVTDIVKVTHFLVHPEDFPVYAQVRSRFLGEHRPASTLLFVSGLVKPELRVEVEVVAARRD